MTKQAQLIEFLQEELEIPQAAIALGLRQSESIPTLLPMVLWQHGIVTTGQLDEIFTWLEAQAVHNHNE